jgi:hypothetical protein
MLSRPPWALAWRIASRPPRCIVGAGEQGGQHVGCVVEVLVQAVGAQQQLVAVLQRDRADVDLDEVAVADRAGDHVLHLRAPGLVGGQHALLDLVVDQRVVVGELA